MRLNAVLRGAAAGRPLVLLHGLFGQAANWGAIQRRLAPARQVIALDLRNHGASPHAPGMDYAAQAGDVLDTLHRLGATPCDLVGHSMGGKVAMAAALTDPAAIARLLVADIAPARYPPAFASHAAAMAAIKLDPGLTRAAADAALHEAVPLAAVRGFLLQNLSFGDRPSWKIGLAEIAAGLPDIADWPDLGRPPFMGPTLFVAGDRSDYIRPEHRAAIAALFPAARLLTLKDSGHWLHADNPAGFIALLEAFLP